MWHISNPFIRRKTLDFSSSGQDYVEVSQLVSEDVVLFNALELTDWDDSETQAIICTSCGFPGCESGGWIVFRKAAERIFIIPAFELLESENVDEYAAPYYLRKLGIPYFHLSTYNALVAADVGLPIVDDIQQLKLNEAARLFQLDAPFLLFDRPPSVSIHPSKADLVLAASEGDHKVILCEILSMLNESLSDSREAELSSLGIDDKVVSIFVDGSEFVEFKCIARRNTGSSLLLDGNLVIERLNN